MNLEELRWFVVLAQTEHATDAAAELSVSQPTLSRALARFEREAGAPLFDRVNRSSPWTTRRSLRGSLRFSRTI